MTAHPVPTSTATPSTDDSAAPTPHDEASRIAGRSRSTRLVLAALVALTVAAGFVAAPTPASAAVCPPAFAEPYDDIPVDHPFCREILQGLTEGWSTGYADDTFRPLNAMTRQSAAAMLWELAAAYNTDLDVLKPCTEDAFPDVPMDHPFCPYVRDAVLAGVFQGYGDGTFRPTQPITRQTAAAILYRFLQGPYVVIGCETSPFTDVTWSNPFCEQILYMEHGGAVYGYPDGTFRPTEVVNRQHFVAMISRMTAWL